MRFRIAFLESKFRFSRNEAPSRFREGAEIWNLRAMCEVSDVMSIIELQVSNILGGEIGEFWDMCEVSDLMSII